MAEVPFTAAREVLREAMERAVSDLVLNRNRPGGDGVTVDLGEQGLRQAYGTSEYRLVADVSLRVISRDPVKELDLSKTATEQAQEIADRMGIGGEGF